MAELSGTVSANTVASTLGISTSNISLHNLCTSANINKWSRRKPVALHNSNASVWYKTPDVDFSLNIPYTTLGTFTTTPNWTYRPPTGAYPLSGYRLGDFRQYNHTSIPPFQISTYPADGSSTNGAIGFEVDVNTTTTLGLTPSEITVDKYGWTNTYFGVKFTAGGSNVWVTNTSNIITTGGSLGLQANDAAFAGYTGTISWRSFLCSGSLGASAVSSLTSPQQAYNVIMLPDEGSFKGSGSFTITAPPPNNPPVVVFDLDMDVSLAGIETIDGTITVGATTAYYYITDTSGGGIALTMDMTVTDVNSNVIDTDTISITTTSGDTGLPLGNQRSWLNLISAANNYTYSVAVHLTI